MNKYDIVVVENAANVCNIKTETPLENVVADCMKDYLEMRKAEEQGLLLRLPCKVGDYAWDLITHYRFEVVSIEIRSCGNIIFRCGNKGTEDYAAFSLEDIGDTWMLTEPKETDYWNPNQEAEQALAEMKEV